MASRARNKTELFSWYKGNWLFFSSRDLVYERSRGVDSHNEIGFAVVRAGFCTGTWTNIVCAMLSL